MISGQRVEIDEPCDAAAGTCDSAQHEEGQPRTPLFEVMLSGWPDSITVCWSCRQRLLRLELDLTRDCALCGGPIQRHAANGRVDGPARCFCTGRRRGRR